MKTWIKEKSVKITEGDKIAWSAIVNGKVVRLKGDVVGKCINVKLIKVKTETSKISEAPNSVKPVVKSSLRADALEWFFDKSEIEKEELKDKYFASEYIAHDSQWGFHFTFGQIEKMYVKEFVN